MSLPLQLSGVERGPVRSALERIARAVGDLILGFGGLRCVRGVVGTTGGTEEGSGWSAAKDSTGDYTVTFTTAFADKPTVVCTPEVQSGQQTIVFLSGSGPTASAFSYAVRRNDTGADIDERVHFIAIGPKE